MLPLPHILTSLCDHRWPVIYVNGLLDNLSADSLLYAYDVKLIVPRNRHDILQTFLNASTA